MARDIAASGAVVWRTAPDGGVEIVLVHRDRYDDWTLPKGKLEAGEAARLAAWREVHEETGARVALGRYLGRAKYRINGDRKIVDYFAARYLSGEFTPSDEVSAVRWLPVAEARSALTHERDHPIVDAFTALPPDLTTLLLVRHAKAGSRAHWDGVDELRPLSKNGQKQVEPVRELARVCGADRVHAAPLLRCVRTVEPIADDLGSKVVEEELLAEKTYEGMEAAVVRRVSEIVGGGGVPVICSQGGVIPDLVRRLANEGDVRLSRHVESKKGSAWALFFAEGALKAANYIQVP